MIKKDIIEVKKKKKITNEFLKRKKEKLKDPTTSSKKKSIYKLPHLLNTNLEQILLKEKATTPEI